MASRREEDGTRLEQYTKTAQGVDVRAQCGGGGRALGGWGKILFDGAARNYEAVLK